MDLLAAAYTGEALGSVWKRMRAGWAKDIPTSELTADLEQSLAESETGKIPYCS